MRELPRAGPWVSYIANYKETTQITDRAGAVIKSSVYHGKQMRASSGDQMLLRFKENNAVPAGRFWEANSGKVFHISYLDKRATLAQSGRPQNGPHHSRAGNPIGTQTIAGLVCDGFPIHKDGRSGEIVGTMWVSLANDIEVKQEIDTTDSQGNRTRWTFELTDIRLGHEPPPEQIRIPADFKVLDRIPARCCATP